MQPVPVNGDIFMVLIDDFDLDSVTCPDLDGGPWELVFQVLNVSSVFAYELFQLRCRYSLFI